MAGWWPAFSRAARRHPWPTNVLLYGSLFTAGDALQQRLQGGEADWRQTRSVATLVVTFHANFNYVWLGLLERALPGRAPRAVLAKLLCDQVVAAPIAISVFYAGMSILQEKDDIFLDLKQKFWNTYLVRQAFENVITSSELRYGHCTPAWATERDSVSKKKKKEKNFFETGSHSVNPG
uniref:Mpv17-like protein n=1 Tax=Piliocolobus tephrosceles TaxID=591936 RepID=A0A8C9GI67_9PRIM